MRQAAHKSLTGGTAANKDMLELNKKRHWKADLLIFDQTMIKHMFVFQIQLFKGN